jgi:hypothetical protein
MPPPLRVAVPSETMAVVPAVSDFVTGLTGAVVGGVIAGVFAIVASVVAARVQARRTEEVALQLRRGDREEQALWELVRRLAGSVLRREEPPVTEGSRVWACAS